MFTSNTNIEQSTFSSRRPHTCGQCTLYDGRNAVFIKRSELDVTRLATWQLGMKNYTDAMYGGKLTHLLVLNQLFFTTGDLPRTELSH
jgi:hypothetical protein